MRLATNRLREHVLSAIIVGIAQLIAAGHEPESVALDILSRKSLIDTIKILEDIKRAVDPKGLMNPISWDPNSQAGA